MSQRLTDNKTMYDLFLENLMRTRGAEEDNENNEEEDEDEENSEGNSGGAGNANSNKESSGSTISEEEFNKLKERMQNADRRASTAESKLKEIEDKDKSELEKATRDLGEVTKERDQLKERNKDLALQLAFVSDNTYSWKNPKAALKLADLSEVTIDDDGKVTGLDKALKALAQSDGYLLKESEDGGNGDKNGDQGNPSGAGGNSKPPNGKFNRESLAKKYRIPR